MRPGLDRVDHLRVGDRRGVALALQQEFWMVDAAGDVNREDQEEVDFLGGVRQHRRERQGDKREQASNDPQHGSLPDCSAAPGPAAESLPSDYPISAALRMGSQSGGNWPTEAET